MIRFNFKNCVIILFVCFNFKFNYINGIKRIWFIRHCDKPSDHENPCCSEYGYKRAENWDYYLTKYLTREDSIKIVTSNFNTHKICMMELNRNPDAYCQKSQRMYLTSHLIYENMKRITTYNISSQINKSFCVGEANKMLKSILETEFLYSDIILVWEHKEIIDLIRSFDIKLEKWKKKYRKHYDLLFMLDVKSNELFYDCFNFETFTTGCSKKIDHWLQDYNKIESYYQKNKLLRSIYYKTNSTQNAIKINFFIAFLTISFYFFILVLYFLYLFIQEFIISYRRRIQGYILIN